MFVDQIKGRLSNGLHPFTICPSDGRKFIVPHQDFIAVSPKIVVVIDAKGISHTIDPFHIVSVSEATAK